MAILLAIGITLYRLIESQSEIAFTYCIPMILILVGAYYWVSYKRKTWILMTIVVGIGFLISAIEDRAQLNIRLSDELFQSAPELTVEVEEIRHYKNSIAIIGPIAKVNGSDRTSPKIILFGKKEDSDLEALRRGSIVKTDMPMSIIGGSENQTFEAYNSYLIDQGIIYRGFINPGKYELYNDRNYKRWKSIRYDAREWALNILDRYLSGDSNAITRALLLGDKSRISKETRNKYAHSGIIHILAVSGLHVGFIVYFLLFIFKRVFFKLGPFSWAQVGFVSIALIGYAEISGGAAPVRRAVIMAILYLVARAMRKQFSPINILGCAAILLLVLSPNELFTVSFQLSFAAVGGIIFFVPYMMRLCPYEHKWIRNLWGIAAMGFAAQISTFPITIYYFNQVPLFSAIAGIIAIPFTGYALCNGALIILFSCISSSITHLLASIQEGLIGVLNAVAGFFSNISFSVWQNVTLNPLESIILIGAVLVLAFFLNTRRSHALVFATFLLLVQAGIHASRIIYNDVNEEMGSVYPESESINQRRAKAHQIYE